MLLPLSTDAPIYHFPFATIGLIVTNLFCFLLTGCGYNTDLWVLEYGHLNPIEWLSSIFAHSGWVHLIGNMIFLWAFGLIVEGKLGWYRFLILYLAIGCGQSGLEQLCMLYKTDSHVLHYEFGVESIDELADQIQEGAHNLLLLTEGEDFSDDQATTVAQNLVGLYKGGSLGASAAIFGLLAICLVWAPKNEFHV